MKKLQTPLYEEFYNNTLNAASPPSAVRAENDENVEIVFTLPPKSRSPNRTPATRLSSAVDVAYTSSIANHTKNGSNVGAISDRTLKEIQSPQSEWKELLLDAQQQPVSLRFVTVDICIMFLNQSCTFLPFYMLKLSMLFCQHKLF